MGGSVKNVWDSTVGKATDKLWNEPTKGIRHTARKVLGDHLYNLGSAVGSAIMGDEMGAMNTLAQVASYKNQYSKIQEDDVVKAAYLAAGAIGAIGAGGGLAMGGAEAGGTAATTGVAATGTATTGVAASGLTSSQALTLGALGLSGASTAYGAVQSRKAASQQAKAQARAEANAAAAERESEILRKRALLASQKSMTARRAAAGAIVNKLKNTSGYLGEDEEKLGD